MCSSSAATWAGCGTTLTRLRMIRWAGASGMCTVSQGRRLGAPGCGSGSLTLGASGLVLPPPPYLALSPHKHGRPLRSPAGSMYAQLRTNLPREVMGFQSFPFDTAWRGSQDPRQFCSHQEVRRGDAGAWRWKGGRQGAMVALQRWLSMPCCCLPPSAPCVPAHPLSERSSRPCPPAVRSAGAAVLGGICRGVSAAAARAVWDRGAARCAH